MEIKQFYDDDLAQASYAIYSKGEIALIDPYRDPKDFYEFAHQKKAEIKAIFETHSHADFVSSHLEISKAAGAKIYINEKAKPEYEFKNIDEGDEVKIGEATIKAIYTPGHSPDSISYLVIDENGKEYAIVTGDTLLIGDVGRPDLREAAGPINKAKEDLARQMFNTINEKLRKLSDDILVYPAHGGGSLCGKGSKTDRISSIKKEREENYAFNTDNENEFVKKLISDQPFIPHYFAYNVALNRKGAPDLEESIKNVKRINSYDEIKNNLIIVDTRNRNEFDLAHFPGAVNLRDESKFETWLGSFVYPEEKFYIISESEEQLDRILRRAAKIGYELNVEAGLVHHDHNDLISSPNFDKDKFDSKRDQYNILDVRDSNEVKEKKIFPESIHIPYHEVRKRMNEIPTGKPVVVHCAGGYRSSVVSSYLNDKIPSNVYDMGTVVYNYN
jgi:hydroxyacylglutathione hydrolase